MKFNELEGKDVTAVQLNRLSTSFNKEGREPDNKWFGKVGKKIYQYRTGDPKNVQESILKFLFEGKLTNYVQMIGGLASGNWMLVVSGLVGNSFQDALTSILKWGGKNGSLVKAGIAAGVSGLAAIVFSILTGTSLLDALRGALNFADVIYEFNFDTPDSAIWQQIKSTIDGLYGQAGDFLGSSFARLLLIGTLSPPKVEIDINGLSYALSDFSEEMAEDLYNGISSFAFAGIKAAKKISFLFAFLNGRKFVRDLANASPAFQKMADKAFPGLGKALQGLGDEENPNTPEAEVKDWRISTFVENKLENVRKNYGQQIGDFVEQFVEGFTDELRDGLDEYIEYRFV